MDIRRMFTYNHNSSSTITNNQIEYTSSDGNIVTPYKTNVFGANIVSNNYINGQGIISFDGPVTTIGYYAFNGCKSLTSITIPDSVTEIGYYAFKGCTSLTSVIIPDSVISIGYQAFRDCYSLTSVTIGNGVTSIGWGAFYYCTSLKSITIPDSVTLIKSKAVYKCTSLTSATIGNGVTKIEVGAFSDCTSLTSFYGKFASSDNRCLIVDGVLNSFAPANLTSYTIPDGVTSIGEEAFYNCERLTSVTIPNSVTTIGKLAFCSCDNLISVTIPNSVTTIQQDAFAVCSSLISITIPEGVISIGMNAFRSCNSLKEFKGKYATEDGCSLIMDNTLIAYANASGTIYTIPNGVTKIGDTAFYGCDELTSITIPNSITTIGSDAFYSCHSLESIYISDISAWCNISFRNAASNPLSSGIFGCNLYLNNKLVTDLTIPNGVMTIGKYAFENCTSLKSVNIPDSVTSIGDYAFYKCSSLTRVYCKATTPPSLGGTFVFDKNGSGRKIYVPTGSVNAYNSATRWSEYADAIVGYDF